MGLGPTHTVSLAKAREKAAANRGMVNDGIDPMEARDAAAVAAAKTITFDDARDRYIEAHKAGWRTPSMSSNGRRHLRPTPAQRSANWPVSAIDVGLVMRVLGPIWTTKNATAFRVRGRIEAILAWATVHGFRRA